jgi:ATP-dependent helicase/DNAse subunit B
LSEMKYPDLLSGKLLKGDIALEHTSLDKFVNHRFVHYARIVFEWKSFFTFETDPKSFGDPLDAMLRVSF